MTFTVRAAGPELKSIALWRAMEMVVEAETKVSPQRRSRSNPMRRMPLRDERIGGQEQLLKLAAWYREFADRAGNPMIWECRLQMAEDLESEACRLARRERGLSPREMRGST